MKSKINIKNKKYKGGRIQYPLAFTFLLVSITYIGIEIASTWAVTQKYDSIPSALKPVASFLSYSSRNVENKTCWRIIAVMAGLGLICSGCLWKLMVPSYGGSKNIYLMVFMISGFLFITLSQGFTTTVQLLRKLTNCGYKKLDDNKEKSEGKTATAETPADDNAAKAETAAATANTTT